MAEKRTMYRVILDTPPGNPPLQVWRHWRLDKAIARARKLAKKNQAVVKQCGHIFRIQQRERVSVFDLPIV